jgi:hypothetical protein
MAVLLGGSAPSGAGSQETLIINEPIEGTAARLDNAQEFRESGALFDNGMAQLEAIIINEGLRRTINLNEEGDEVSNQTRLEDTVRNLQLCKDGCENPEERCDDQADRALNTLLATSCKADFGQCQVICLENLLKTVSDIPDISSSALTETGEDPGLEQEREMARVAISIGET